MMMMMTQNCTSAKPKLDETPSRIDDDAHATRDAEDDDENGRMTPMENGVPPPPLLPTAYENSLILDDLSYGVKVWAGRWYQCGCVRRKLNKRVLNSISAVFKHGQITAVMGNSGSGKTSLLDVIASRVEGRVEGSVTLHHQPLSLEAFRSHAGYVIQADRLLPNLTVEETLTYTAQLKFLGECAKEDIQQKVNAAIEDMGLRHIRNARIGGAVIKGISGGEKRRVSVAIQLLQDPELLLLDEPTTGLDSFTARHLVQSLAHLAHSKKKIVLLSIHQPRSELFAMFDQVGLLSQGEMVYFGPQEDMVSYFTALGYPCPTYANPLDHYIDVVSVDHRDADSERETLCKVQELRRQYRHSVVYTEMLSIIEAKHQPQHTDMDTCLSKTYRCEMQKTFMASGIILRRMTVNLMRGGTDLSARLLTIVAYAFFLWIFLMNLGNDLTSLQDRAGIFYQSTSGTPMVGLLSAVALFPPMRSLYYREAGDGLYGSTPFLVAFYIHILPYHLISSLIYSTWVYWGLGMYPDAGRFGIYYVVMVLMQMFGELQTVLVLGIVDSPALASGISTLTISVFVLTATGLIRATASMPAIIEWISYLSYMKYAVEIIAANEFDGLKLECSEDVDFPCDGFGQLWLNYFFPDSIENMGRNFAIIFAYLGGLYLLIILLFKVRRVKQLH